MCLCKEVCENVIRVLGFGHFGVTNVVHLGSLRCKAILRLCYNTEIIKIVWNCTKIIKIVWDCTEIIKIVWDCNTVLCQITIVLGKWRQ